MQVPLQLSPSLPWDVPRGGFVSLGHRQAKSRCFVLFLKRVRTVCIPPLPGVKRNALHYKECGETQKSVEQTLKVPSVSRSRVPRPQPGLPFFPRPHFLGFLSPAGCTRSHLFRHLQSAPCSMRVPPRTQPASTDSHACVFSFSLKICAFI